MDRKHSASKPPAADVRGVALLLDFGGTLDGDGIHWSPRFHEAYAATGGTTPFEAFDHAFRLALRSLGEQSDTVGLGFEETVHLLSVGLTARLADGSAVDLDTAASRFHADACAAVERNRPTLERLSSSHRIALISNFTGNLAVCVRELGVDHCFEAIVDSGRFGVSKPDARIFEEGLRRLDARAESTWMLGDNPDADILPALALGMRACWISPREREFPGETSPTARIARFPEIAGLLEGTSAP